MSRMSRRDFLKLSGKLSVLMGLSATAVPQIAEALSQIASGNAPLLWLQGQSCSGCSVSLLNSEAPTAAELLTRYVSLRFHGTLSAATGHVAMDTIHKTMEAGGYLLAVEGAIPAGMPEACQIGHEKVSEQVAKAARNATAVVAVGSCATSGGIPGAEGNPTGAVSVPQFLKDQGIATPVISVPGCPIHPDWLVGTLAHVLKFGLPELDDHGRPKAFFSRLIHEQCPRFADYEREKFAKTFGDEGCLFKLGCTGPNTHADCTIRLWNNGVNSCIHAGAPCIGCAGDEFAAKRSFAFYRKGDSSNS